MLVTFVTPSFVHHSLSIMTSAYYGYFKCHVRLLTLPQIADMQIHQKWKPIVLMFPSD